MRIKLFIWATVMALAAGSTGTVTAQLITDPPAISLDFTGSTLPEGLEFSRNSHAMYFDSQGRLRYAAHNLVADTEDYSGWSQNNASVTVFERVNTVASAGTGPVRVQSPILVNIVKSVGWYSVRMKIDSALPDVEISLYDSEGDRASQTFDLSLGAVGPGGATEGGVFDTPVDARLSSGDADGFYVVSFNVFRNTPSAVGASLAVEWNAQTAGETVEFTEPSLYQGRLHDSYRYYANKSEVAAAFGPRVGSHIWNGQTWENQGLFMEETRFNYALWNRDLTRPVWLKSDVLAARDAIGLDGFPNSATSVTAMKAFAEIWQSVPLPLGPKAFSLYLKRRSGLGTVEITMDGGLIWTALNGISSTRWTRYSITDDLPDPMIGLRLEDIGDAVEVDFVQVEEPDEQDIFPTSPIATTNLPETRAMGRVWVPDIMDWYADGPGTTVTRVSQTQLTTRKDGGFIPDFEAAYTISNNTSNKRIFHVQRPGYTSTGEYSKFKLSDSTGGTVQGQVIEWTPWEINKARTIASAWDINDVTMKIEGGVLVHDNSYSPAISGLFRLDIGNTHSGNAPLNGHVTFFRYYQERKSDLFLLDVADNQPPVAGFDATTDGLSASFLDTSTDDGVIVTRLWDFGDGTTSSFTNPTHTYGEAGTFLVTLGVTDDVGSGDSISQSITVSNDPPPPANTPPLANAGPDQTVTDADGSGTEAVTLDGTGSSDQGGTIASYEWSEGGSQSPTRSVIFGPTDISFLPGSAFSGPQTRSQTLAVDATGFQNLTVSFTVAGIDDIEPNCGTGGSSDCFEVFEGAVSIVGPFDIPCVQTNGPCDPALSLTPFGPIPVAPADPSNLMLKFEIRVTDGFDEGAIFSNITVEGDTIAVAPNIIAVGEMPTVTLAVGVHTITLTVTDNDGATNINTDNTVVVTVVPPVANPIYGVAVTPPADALSGAPGAAVPYTLTVTNNGNVSDSFNVAVTGSSWATTPSPSPIGPIAAGASGSLTVDVVIPGVATDGQFDTATVTLTSQGDGTMTDSSTLTTTAVVAANTAPTVTISAPTEGANFTAGASVSFSGSASDAEDGILTSSLTWTSNLDGPISSGGTFSTSTMSEGAHLITAQVTDSGGLPGSDQVNIIVNPPPTDPPEVTTSTFSGRITGNSTITRNILIEAAGRIDARLSWDDNRASLNLAARDPNSTILASDSGSNPIDISFATTGPGTYSFVINNTSRRKTDYTLSVTHPVGASPPPPPVTLTSVSVAPASASIAEGQTRQFSATGTFSDGSTADFTTSATWTSSTTAVATINASGLASGVLAGTTNITASQDGTTSNTATLTVTAPQPDTEPPSISVDDPGFSVSGTVTLSATASDNVGVTQVEFLVDGISIGTDTTAPYSVGWNTGAVADGDHTIAAVAEDAAGNVGLSLPVTVTVANAAPPSPALSLTVTAPASEARGDEFTVDAIIANDGGSAASGLTATLSWTPSGNLRLRGSSAAQSVATISAGSSNPVNWTLRGDNEGTVILTVTVTDGGGTVAEQSVSMQINN